MSFDGLNAETNITKDSILIKLVNQVVLELYIAFIKKQNILKYVFKNY